MSKTLFISDLHLDTHRPTIVQLAAAFLRDRVTRSDALYILGDLFEYWIGDDQPTPGLEPVLEALLTVKQAGVPVFLITGNRDFLLGDSFCHHHGMTRLSDSAIIDLYGQPTLIMHGDTLCTDDIQYQQLRVMLRDPAWQQQFLALPLPERIKQALALRKQSESETGDKDERIMDVNTDTVAAAMRQHGVTRLIHGHTHRPAMHDFQLDGQSAQRIVLGDWYQSGSVLSCDDSGCHLERIDG
jgi:UDP-2,3-diacylglucosamine hydrolase